jgi:ribose-phosphate pyrophosphokinase
MISTGGTIAESTRALTDAGAVPEYLVAATHAVLAPGALDRIAAAGVHAVVVTDTIEARETGSASLVPALVSVAPLLAVAIRRLLAGGSLRELS